MTKVNDESQAAKDFFSVFGPPATLFVDGAGNGRRNNRIFMLNVSLFAILMVFKVKIPHRRPPSLASDGVRLGLQMQNVST